jgi:hypothetical protein
MESIELFRAAAAFILESSQLPNNPSVKRLYESVTAAMAELIGYAEPAHRPVKPPPCSVPGLTMREQFIRRWHRTRVYALTVNVSEAYPEYRAILVCSPMFRNHEWVITDPRLAIVRPDNTANVSAAIARYYRQPSNSVVVVTKEEKSFVKDALTQSGLLLCHSLEEEAEKTAGLKKRKMQNTLNQLVDQFNRCGVWPKTARTAASERLDYYIDHASTVAMVRMFNQNKTTQEIVTTLESYSPSP